MIQVKIMWKSQLNLSHLISSYLILSHLISYHLVLSIHHLISTDSNWSSIGGTFLTVDHCGKHWPKPWPWQCILYHRIQLYKTFIKLQGPWNQVLWTSYNHNLNHCRYEYDSTMMQVYASITQVWKVILIVHVCVYLVASSYFYLLYLLNSSVVHAYVYLFNNIKEQVPLYIASVLKPYHFLWNPYKSHDSASSGSHDSFLHLQVGLS